MATRLTDDAEVLFRQIHPHFLHDGEPGSDRFRPSEKDQNQLSIDRSSLTSAHAAHELYVSGGKQSAAVFGLSVGEFGGEGIPCVEDPIAAGTSVPANPAHALADYSTHEVKKQKVVAKRLKKLAVTRGCLHATSSE